jgi:hypothetical protein
VNKDYTQERQEYADKDRMARTAAALQRYAEGRLVKAILPALAGELRYAAKLLEKEYDPHGYERVSALKKALSQ